jgi:hypothetical protein
MGTHKSRLKSIRPCTYVTFLAFDATLRSCMTTATKNKYRCMQCEMTEDRCACEKYCCLCESMLEVRLCQDGLYYCEPCREACDYKTAD